MLIESSAILLSLAFAYMLYQLKGQQATHMQANIQINEALTRLQESIDTQAQQSSIQTAEAKARIEQLQKNSSLLQSQLKTDILQTLLQTLKHQHDKGATDIKHLTEMVHKRLGEISEKVNQKLTESFEKNSSVMQDVAKHMALIKNAQNNITQLSEKVVDLQNILTDKSSRGAYGEVQLEQLVANVIPNQHFTLQATLSNGKRVDCLLKLPEPSGDIAIDAKFPLENFQHYCKSTDEQSQKAYHTQFKTDMKKHIDDISSKYIIPAETAEGAIMFIPAESIFAHIHAHVPELVTLAHKKNVWICSPTTLMAVLNTALSVIKDHSTKTQVVEMKKHLAALADDFARFDKRMGQLARHIDQAQNDVGLIQTSSNKITRQFQRIESCEVGIEEQALID